MQILQSIGKLAKYIRQNSEVALPWSIPFKGKRFQNSQFVIPGCSHAYVENIRERDCLSQARYHFQLSLGYRVSPPTCQCTVKPHLCN